MPKRDYTRDRMRLTSEHVKRAQAMISAGKVGDAVIEWRDERCMGLVLRITPRAGIWYLRRRDRTIRLGSIDVLTVEDARFQADEARLALKRGKDPKAKAQLYESVLAQSGDEELAWELSFAAETSRHDDRARSATGPWRWREMRAEFLAMKKKKLKPKYFPLYARYLEHEAFKAIEGKLVSDLTRGDLEGVRNQILKVNAPSAAYRAVHQGKEMLNWAYRHHSGISGLEKIQHPWWQMWSIEYETGTRDHVPTIEELARTLVIAEHHRTLAEKEHETSPGTLAALWAVVLTAQRTGALVVLPRNRLFNHRDYPGWKIANWTQEEMKGGPSGGRPHALPLPPVVMETFARFWAEYGKDSPYAFPSGKGDGHVTQSALNRLLYRLEGKVFRQKVRRKPDRPSKPGPKPKKPLAHRENLLARYGVRPWTLHDVRRTLATFLDDNRLGGAGSAILAHKTSKEEDEKERKADVTQIHYTKSQRIPLKAQGMELWVTAVMEAYEKEKANLEKILRRAA